MSRTEHGVRPVRFRFRAMNTDVEVQLATGLEEAMQAEALIRNWFETQERRFSRFLPDSELSRLNRSTGWMPVSAAMDEVLSLAYGYMGQTEGMFQPGILPALREQGYEASFGQEMNGFAPQPSMTDQSRITEIMRTHERSVHSTTEPYDYSRPRWIQREGSRMVHIDHGTQLDLGGIVKGWTVERIAEWLRRTLRIPAGMINAGGDMQTWGTSDHPAWTIYVTDPFLEKRNLTGSIQLRCGAVATSGIWRRRWRLADGSIGHHLIDPRTMASAETDVLQCTVLGKHASQCEIIAKTVCILGSEDALRWLNRHHDPHDVLWITKEGNIIFRGDTELLEERWPGIDPDHRFHLL
ncbi:FAD:protein FMN transferase [Paenibacillus sp. JJ-223]|uniref:FAD:protein FMN transferase n=1 Tax=Paenibacillus sp. JJ-223 TaxID=2905647 RepID=UPI001F3EDDD0|nr:FAD:protein FMN transferase [Paenibacillus sp. JJ-223]CAH1201143.1 FAD:protein FMN transferase [Paenibacillus sp. JJ-223]